jgi:phosphate ABC transporter permease subunit PstA
MSAAGAAAASVTTSIIASGRSKDRNNASLAFVGALWFSLFFGVLVLFALLLDTAIEGAPRFDSELVTNYGSRINTEEFGFRAGILGSIWLMITTAFLSVPLGIATAIYLEEFASKTSKLAQLVEINLQNLAAVPAIIYGLLAAAVMGAVSLASNIVLAGAVALTLLILPVIIITSREAMRAVPDEIRQGSLALGATVWQTTWRNTLPAAIPGIATGTILGLSRAVGEAAPLVVLGVVVLRNDPGSIFDRFTALPMEIYFLSSESREALQVAASAAIIVLMVLILAMNGLAIYIRNRFQRSW